MSHQGRSVQELWSSGVREVSTLQHAAMDEGGTLTFIEHLSPESRQEAIESGVIPEEQLDVLEGGGSLEDLLNNLLDGTDAGGPAESITETGARGVVGETTRDITATEQTQFLELINRISREYIDVPTAEELLNNFENAFAGFAANATEAGLDQGDVQAMLDPRSGFMQSMLQEYMGEIAQKAEAGEDIYDVVGVDGGEEFLGTRAGDVVSETIGRMSRTQAEEVLRQRGEQITNESVQRVIDEDFQQQQSSLAETTDLTVTETGETISGTTGETRLEETEEIYARPRVTPVFAFSPTEFFLTRFAPGTEGTPEEVRERFLGRMSTEIRTSAPGRRAGTGTTVAGARRT